MSTFAEFTNSYLKKKKQSEEELINDGAQSLAEFTKAYLGLKDDVAPVAQIPTVADRTWFQSGAFSDGYQIGDLLKTIGGTLGDIGIDVVKGAGRMVEGVVDLGGHLVASGADLIGQQQWADKFRNEVNNSFIDESFAPTDEFLNQYSVLGAKSDAVGEGIGQVAALILTGGALSAAGVGAAGVTAATTGLIGASSAGSGISEAYLGGASDEDAYQYGLLKGAIDAGTEMIFGGLGKAVNAVGLSRGISSLDDMLARGLSSKISNRILHNLVELGVKASAEGFEEVLAGLGTAFAKQWTYMPEEDIKTLIEDENLLEQFIVGAVTSGIMQSGIVPGTDKGSLIETVKQDRDLVGNLNYTEEAVVNKIYNDRITEAQKNGENLTVKEQNKIYDDILDDLEKGRIDVKDIEKVWGEGVSSEFMSKGTKLAESYNEKARRGQAFQANIADYAANQRETIKKAVSSGVLNNTNKTHDFVNLIAKISADKGIAFDFTNNKRLKGSGFAVKGADVNAYVGKNGITLNVDSPKAWQSTVGHEITHVLQGTEFYNELQRLIFDYAKSKGDYQRRYDDLSEVYQGVHNANIELELTADLVGDYLFTDESFVKHLSAQNRNIFQKIYDEIKYLWKLITAGSKEARDLERVKHAFDKAYRQRVNGNAINETQFSASYKESIDKYTKKQYNDFGWARYANAITKNELDDMHSKLHEKGSLKKFPQTKYGEAVVEINDDPHALLGTDNVFAFVTGTINDPQINRVARFDVATEEEMEIIKEKLYEKESFSNSYYSFLKQYGFAREYSKQSSLNYTEYKEATRGEGSGKNGNHINEYGGHQQDRSGTLAETQSNEIAPIKASSKDGVFYSLSKYTAEEKKAHNDAVLKHFGKTYKWAETGYLLLDGSKLDLSGKHDGAPGGYRTVDHRDITEALGYDYGGGDYSGSLVQFMSEGNIRIVPENNGINLSVKPTKAQEQALSDYISRARGEVVLDIDNLNGNTIVSIEYPRGTHSTKVLNDIREWFDNGKQPETSGIAAFRSLTKKSEQQKRYGNYSTPLNELKIDKSVKKATTNNNTTSSKPIVSIDDDIAPVTEESKTRIVVDDESGAREKKGFVESVKSGAMKARTHLVDNYSVFEDLALKTGNRELDSKANFMRYSEQRAQNFIGNGTENVRALADLREEVKASGLDQEFQEYMYDMHNTDRMNLENRARTLLRKFGDQFKGVPQEQIKAIAARKITEKTTEKTAQKIRDAREYVNLLELKNKPVRGANYTAEMSRANAQRLEALYPQFKEWAKDIYNINDFLRQKLVDDGEISKETAELWQKIYPHYVPIRRLDSSGNVVGEEYVQQAGLVDPMRESNDVGINAPLQRAVGGSANIDDLFRTLAMRIEQTYKAGAKNRFGLELKNTLASTVNTSNASIEEMIEGVDTHEDRLKKGKDGTKSTFTVFDNGEKIEFEITDEMYEALQPANDLFSGTNKVLNTATKFQKSVLTEFNPFFTVRNIIKDAQDVFINSQHASKTYSKMPTAAAELLKYNRGADTKWAKEYFENGGEQNTYFDSRDLTFKKEDSAFKKVLGFIPRKISEASNFVERVPRLAEYIASRESGASIETAMMDAARVTTNFAAGGDVTKWANRNGFTFLNASVQGTAQQVRNIREAKAKGLKGMLELGAKYVVAGLPFVLLNALMWDDDEDYENLSDYVKENYYIVAKYGDGQFVRIPKGRAMAVIQNAFQQMSNWVTGNDEVDLERFGELLIENLAPNNPIENNVFAPINDALSNKTWYGDELVPTRLQDLPSAEQYDETTDSISKWIGENTGTSPYKWNYVLDQYSGIFGDMLLPMYTQQAESGDDSVLGNIIAPVKDQFTTDSVLKNQNVSDFYDTVDELAKNANSKNATAEDVLKYKYMNSINSDLSDLYKQKREIQSSNLADPEKYEAVRNIQKQIDAITEASLNSYDNVKVYGDYAEVGDKSYRLGNDGVWQKITDSQLEKQEFVTSTLGISPAEYWGNKTEYDFAYEYPGRYGIAKAVGGFENYRTFANDLYDIKADIGANGNAITGSRKKKVADYINDLDISYEEKIILFKSEYPTDNTYNKEIVEYLNSRNDISYSDMVSILQELGFTVKGDTVTW